MIYLLHFAIPYHHARHYIGFTTNINQRLARHRSGNGSPLMAAVTRAGIHWELVRTWNGTRKIERKLKDMKNAPLLCPDCNPNAFNRAILGD